MSKIVRRALVFLAGFLLLISLALGSLLLPSVQSYIGRKVSEALSRHIPQQISVGRIDIRPSGRVCLQDILVLDHRGDTLVSADSVRARMSLRGILRGRLSFSRVEADAPRLQVIKYPGDSLHSLAMLAESFKREKEREKKPFYLDIGRLRLRNGNFSFSDRASGLYRSADEVSLTVSGVSVAPWDYRVRIDTLSSLLSGGTQIRRLSGDFRFAPQGIVADGIEVTTSRSDLRFSAAAYFRRADSTGAALGERLRGAQFTLSVEPSRIDPRDAEVFFPQAGAVPPVDLSARITAQEGLLDIKELKIAVDKVFSTDVSGRVESTGSLREGNGKAVLKNVKVFPARAIAVMNAVTGKHIPKKTYDKLSDLEYLSGSALLTLADEDVTAVASLFTPRHGKVYLRGQSADLWNRKNARYTGRAVLENIDAGLLFGARDLGNLTLLADIRGKGFDPATAQVELGASIPLLEFKGYPYTGIGLSFTLSQGKGRAEVAVDDPNLAAKLTAGLQAAPVKGAYRGTLDVYLDKCDLHALGLVRDSIVNVRGTIQADAWGTGIDDVEGTLDFSEMSYNNGGSYYYIERIGVRSQRLDSVKRRLSVESEGLFDGYIEGDYRLSQVPAAVTNGLLSGFKPYKKKKVDPGQKYDFQFNIAASNVKVVNTSLVFDGNTHLGGTVDTSDDDFSFDILADRINYRDVLVDTLQFHLNTANANVLNVKAQKFINPVYSIEDLDFSALRYADSVALRSDFRKWNAPDSVAFRLNAYLKDDAQGNVILGVLPSSIDLERIKWRFGSRGIPGRDHVVWNVESGLWRLDSLSVVSGSARISANGFYAPRDSMDMRFEVRSLDLSRVVFLRNNIPLQGELNASVHLSKEAADRPFIPEASLRIDSLAVGVNRIGDLDLSVNADLANRYVNTSARLTHGLRDAFSLLGGLRIVPGEGLVPEMDVALDSLPVDAVRYLLPTVFNRSTGYASARLAVRGTMKDPQVDGAVRLDATRLGIKFTNVEYVIPDATVVPVRGSFFYFEKIPVRDAVYATGATLDGRIYHDRFKRWYLDLRADADRTLALNTTGEGEEKFYGRVFATGYMKLRGPTNALKYDIAARTERNTFFAIDIGGTSDFKDSPMITFVPPHISHVDSLLANLKKKIVREIPETSSEMNIAVEATPDATLVLYLDKTSGHMIEATGQGGLSMYLSPKGAFTLNGTYQAVAGTYTFVYQNLIKRAFTLLSGGRITFDGDPSNPSLDLSASYKTTVKPAVYLSSVAENAREEVVTTIHLTGDLSDPVYNFDIQMPRATENVREELAYRLSDQEQLNQQFISLMALNSFTATGENDNQNVVATGVTGLTAGMLSSQFSNILQRFVRGVDINVNLNISTNRYMGTTESTDFEVGISTKFFGDRMTVNGVVGVPTGTTQSDLAGDVEIEYNITPDGRFRAVFVNRRQNDYLNNQQGYMQSVGVSYRQEFNTFRELGQLIKQSFAGKNAQDRKKARAERKAEKARRQDPVRPTDENGSPAVPAGIPDADTVSARSDTIRSGVKISFR